jgi:hypothetical protein
MSRFEFADPTDGMAGEQYRKENSANPSGIVIHFRHVPTDTTAEFKAFITEFDDSFTSAWNGQEVWGRMDEIRTFKNTKRKINISWTTPAHSEQEAKDNFSEIGKMIQMQYPLYEDIASEQKTTNFDPQAVTDVDTVRQNFLTNNTQNEDDLNRVLSALDNIENTILKSRNDSTNLPIPSQNVSLLSSPPIIQMKFMNWAASDAGDGLYGTLDDFKFKPDLEAGVFLDEFGNLIPMTCECSVSLTVIHTDKLGWNRDKTQRTFAFPYQAIPIK